MLHFFQVAAHKAFAGVMAVLAVATGIFTHPRTVTITPTAEVATISEVVTSQSGGADIATTTPSSTTREKPEPKIVEAPPAPKETPPPAKSAEKPILPPPPPVIKKTSLPPPTKFTGPITAQALLDATTLATKQKFSGGYAVALNTGIGNLTWGLQNATIGDGGTIPKFESSFACDPPPNLPASGDIDQTPSFNVRTTYRCTISLAALVGSDRSAHKKDFSFETAGGQLGVSPSPTIDPLLKDDHMMSGFVFNNRDSQTITVTDLKLDISYAALSLDPIPPIIRFMDSFTDKQLAEYDLGQVPEDTSHPMLHTKTSIDIPVTFPIPAGSQKMIAVHILGVRKIRSIGNDPDLKISLRDITTDPGDVKTVFNFPQLHWACIMPTTAYDPNATSGPFATGQACRE